MERLFSVLRWLFWLLLDIALMWPFLYLFRFPDNEDMALFYRPMFGDYAEIPMLINFALMIACTWMLKSSNKQV